MDSKLIALIAISLLNLILIAVIFYITYSGKKSGKGQLIGTDSPGDTNIL